MGSSYYYFAASLPFLEFGMSTPLSVATFLSDCGRLLSRRDQEEARLALTLDEDLTAPVRDQVSQRWRDFLYQFRNHAVWARANLLKKDPHDHLQGEWSLDPSWVGLFQEIERSEDPLAGETMLERFRWNKLEELEQGHFFDRERIIIYGLKLKILERLESVDSVQGQEIFSQYQEQAGQLFERL